MRQALVAVNLERNEQGMASVHSIDDLSSGERGMLNQAWETAHAQVLQQQHEFAFTQAMRGQAGTGTGTGTTPTTRSTTTPGTTVAATTAATAAGAAGSPQPGANGHHTTTGNVTPAGHDELSLEGVNLTDLTDRIYDRLRSRLRTELLIDRERAGLLTDFR